MECGAIPQRAGNIVTRRFRHAPGVVESEAACSTKYLPVFAFLVILRLSSFSIASYRMKEYIAYRYQIAQHIKSAAPFSEQTFVF